jgi:hypothetical protein
MKRAIPRSIGSGREMFGTTRAPYSRDIMATASRSRSTYGSPLTSTATLIVPPQVPQMQI